MSTIASNLKILLFFSFILGSGNLCAQIQGNSPVCVGDSLHLSISSSSGTVTWTGPNGHSAIGINWHRQIRNIADSGWYVARYPSGIDSIYIRTIGCPRCTQREGDNWLFGNGAGINFSSGSPTVLSNSAINTGEGSAAISDPQGNLLFYTDGIDVWNRNHQLMPNGRGLFGNSSATQSGVIVPHPGNLDLYYIFTVDYIRGTNGLNYSLVDMRLNGGLGDVTTKNVNLFRSTTEKITAAKHANGYEYWLISHPFNTSAYNCYHVTLNGLNTNPVVSTTGSIHGPNTTHKIGVLKVSPNGDKVACALFQKNIFEVLDFDPATGRLSNPLTLLSTLYRESYGVEFSPDGSKLYGTTLAAPSKVLQFDLTLGSAAQIVSNAVILRQNSMRYWYGQLQLGPDGKLYVARFNSQVGSRTLDVIEFPNDAAANIGYQDDGLNLGTAGFCNLGLPNFIPSTFQQLNAVANYTCLGLAGAFEVDSIPGADYLWIAPNNMTHRGRIWQRNDLTLSDTGWYLISAEVGGCSFIDSVYLDSLPYALSPLFLGADTFICDQSFSPILLNPNQPNANSYLWQNGSTSPTFTVTQTGLYWVEITNACHSIRDTIIVDIQLPLPAIELGPDSSLCEGDSIRIGTYAPSAQYTWQDGRQDSFRTIYSSGLYIQEISNACGSDRDSVQLIFNPLPNIYLGNDTILCEGDLLTFDLRTGATGAIQWENGSSDSLRTISSGGLYWAEARTLCGLLRDSLRVIELSAPAPFSLGADTILCSGDSLFLNGYQGDTFSYLWLEDGDNFWEKSIFETGMYTLEISNVCGTVSDDIVVTQLPYPSVDLGKDTVLCEGEMLSLEHENNELVHYFWSNGEIVPNILVNTSGLYSLRAFNVCDTVEQTIEVTVEPCECTFFMPNAFTPNSDRHNELFGPKYDCPIRNFKLMIYDRWGRVVYVSQHPDDWWDGTHQQQGGHVPEGVYVWTVSFEGSRNRIYLPYNFVGTVTLIR